MNEQNNSQGPMSGFSNTPHQPIFLLPNAVSILAVLLLVIHGAYELALDGDGKLQMWIWFGFIPARLVEADIPGGLLPLIWTPVTHAFLHGDWTHVLMNVAWLLIFGTPVARRYGSIPFFIIFLAGAVGGVGLFAMLQMSSGTVLIGASGGVAGLTGAAMRFVFQPVQMARNPETGEVVTLGRKLASLREIWASSRARTFTLFWLGLNLAIPVYGFFVGSEGATIAWQAHLGGFFVGLALPWIIERWKVSTKA